MSGLAPEQVIAARQGAVQQDETPEDAICANGRVRIGDLVLMQEAFAERVDEERAKATAWQPDARLVGLRVGCRLLDNGFTWRGIFFSDLIQSYFFSDTGETRTVDVVAPPGPTLTLDDVNFRALRQSLVRSGFDDSLELNPSSNVEIRLNSTEAPFGPPGAPLDTVLFHVAIEFRGDVIDLFISAEDGTPYQFRS